MPSRTASDDLVRKDAAAAAELVAAVRRGLPALIELVDSLPLPLLLLDADLRIVHHNPAARELIDERDGAPPVGLRPGEALGCLRAQSAPGVCTRDPDCAGCGAREALTAALSRDEARAEWCFTVSAGGTHETRAFDLQVRRLAGHGLPLLWAVSLRDVGEERRKEAMQRLFFHDILNVVGGVRGLSQLIPEMSGAERDECLGLLDRLGLQLMEMIGAHRDLLWTEKGELKAAPEPLDLRACLDDLLALYEHHPVAERRVIAFDAPAPGHIIVTDGRLLARVVGNLLKNALEASEPGETVTVRARVGAGQCEITVHNPAHIPPDELCRVFQRSFSTKSLGRGLGTYSARLFTERCLGGTVIVQSTPDAGTTFTVRIPLEG